MILFEQSFDLLNTKLWAATSKRVMKSAGLVVNFGSIIFPELGGALSSLSLKKATEI